MQAKTPSMWRWLGRIGLFALLCLVVASAAWGLWWREAKHRCDASIAAIRARGEPVRWTDVVLVPASSNEQNAAWHLTRAASSLTGVANMSRPEPGTPLWKSTAERDIAANPTAFELVCKARGCKEVDWGTTRDQYGHPPIPTLLNTSTLARLLRDQAILHHLRGEDRQAIEYWRDIESQSRIIGTRPTTLVSGLVCLIVNGIGVEALDRIAPDIHIGGADGLDADALRALIAQLEEDGELRESVAQGFVAERLNATNVYLAGQFRSGPWLLRPLLYLHLQRRFDDEARNVDSIRNSTNRPPPPPQLFEDKIFGVTPQFSSVGDDVIRCVLRRRVVAATLAIQLYRHERGMYPATLEQLIPGYLHALPRDPRSGNTRPLGYLRAADGARPVFYSAGPSKLTADQIAKALPAFGVSPDTSAAAADIIFFDVSTWTGNPPSIPQSRNDQPQ